MIHPCIPTRQTVKVPCAGNPCKGLGASNTNGISPGSLPFSRSSCSPRFREPTNPAVLDRLACSSPSPLDKPQARRTYSYASRKATQRQDIRQLLPRPIVRSLPPSRVQSTNIVYSYVLVRTQYAKSAAKWHKPSVRQGFSSANSRVTRVTTHALTSGPIVTRSHFLANTFHNSQQRTTGPPRPVCHLPSQYVRVQVVSRVLPTQSQSRDKFTAQTVSQHLFLDHG